MGGRGLSGVGALLLGRSKAKATEIIDPETGEVTTAISSGPHQQWPAFARPVFALRRSCATTNIVSGCCWMKTGFTSC
jgi:hypothetical protein